MLGEAAGSLVAPGRSSARWWYACSRWYARNFLLLRDPITGRAQPVANPSCSEARTSFGIPSYAASRISWWLTGASVRPEDRTVRPDHLLADSATGRCGGAAGRGPGKRLTEPGRRPCRPRTALDDRRSCARRIDRASRTPGGRDGDGHQVADGDPGMVHRTSRSSSISMESISSTNSGLPSAASGSVGDIAGSPAGRAGSRSAARTPRRERLERDRRGVQLAAAPRRA